MKKKLLMFSLIFVCLFSVFTLAGCGNNNDNNTPPALTGTEATFKDFTKVDDTTYSIKVANATETFNFSNSVSVANDSKWQLTADIYGIVDIPSKIGTLDIGDNEYFVLVTDNEDNVKLYTLQIRRRPIYTVTFNTNGGSNLESIEVEEDSLLPNNIETPIKEDYCFSRWDYDLSSPIVKNTTLSAIYDLKEYKITYNLDDGQNNVNNLDKFTIEDYPINLLNPTRTDADFDGWYLDSSFNNKISVIENIHNDIQLYAKWLTMTEGLLFKENENDVEIIGYQGADTNIYIRNSYNNKPITKINERAFYQQSLTKIYIPNTVTEIGACAFAGNTLLTDVVFQENGKLILIAQQAFDGCINLININIPSSIEIFGTLVFNNCNNLNLVRYDYGKYIYNGTDYVVLIEAADATDTIHSSTKIIYDNAFELKGYNTRSITIPDSVTYIGQYAFTHSDFIQITFGMYSNIKYIDYRAFSYGSVNKLYIPESLEYISYGAFQDCYITNIEFAERDNNKSLRIEYDAFTDCSNLKTIYIPSYVQLSSSCCFAENDTLIIYCQYEEDEIPTSWGTYWNKYYLNSTWYEIQVVFGVTFAEYLQLINQ